MHVIWLCRLTLLGVAIQLSYIRMSLRSYATDSLRNSKCLIIAHCSLPHSLQVNKFSESGKTRLRQAAQDREGHSDFSKVTLFL